MVRVQFDITPERLAELEQLRVKLGLDTRKDLFNNALTLLEWAAREASQGRAIASIGPDEKSYRELVMPCLMKAKG